MLAEVIQKPDGVETTSARSTLSFSQQMFVFPVRSEAFFCWIDTELFALLCLWGAELSLVVCIGLIMNISGQYLVSKNGTWPFVYLVDFMASCALSFCCTSVSDWSDKPLSLSFQVVILLLICWWRQTHFLCWCLQIQFWVIHRRISSRSFTQASEFPSFVYSYSLQAGTAMMSI